MTAQQALQAAYLLAKHWIAELEKGGAYDTDPANVPNGLAMRNAALARLKPEPAPVAAPAPPKPKPDEVW